MKYQVTEKKISEKIVFTAETVLKAYSDNMQWIPSVGQECLKLNPDMKCAKPPYDSVNTSTASTGKPISISDTVKP